jgi:hypothetical protein
MVQELETRSYGPGAEASPSDTKSDIAALRAENERLKTLVVELTAIIAKSVIDRK